MCGIPELNVYQWHHVQVKPPHLEDPTKSGHNKILVLLVDPTQRVPSATDVGPQQREWVTEIVHGADPKYVFGSLPVELLTMISDEVDGSRKYREELMTERTVFVEANSEDCFGMVRARLRCALRAADPSILTVGQEFKYSMWYCFNLQLRLLQTHSHDAPHGER